MQKLGVGVLGLGQMGKRHADNLRRLVPGARLVAVADVIGERARQVAAELEVDHFYDSLEDMLDNREIEAVLIATPDAFHAQEIVTAARAGKAILCEKPLALNIADARAALAEVARSGARLQVGFMRRFDPPYVAAMKRIEAGEIGVPVVFKSVGRDKEAPPLAAYRSGINGTLLYSNTVHDFDLARWLMHDEIDEVHSYTTTALRPEIAPYGDVMASTVNLRYCRDAIGNIESCSEVVYGYDVRTEIVGSKGSILVGILPQAPAVFLTSGGGVQSLTDDFLTRFADAYLLEVCDFVRNVAEDRPLQVSGEDGFAALAIAVAAERSHLQAKPVRVSSVL